MSNQTPSKNEKNTTPKKEKKGRFGRKTKETPEPGKEPEKPEDALKDPEINVERQTESENKLTPTGKTFVIITDQKGGKMQPCKVTDDHWIEYYQNYRKKKKEIDTEAQTLEIPHAILSDRWWVQLILGKLFNLGTGKYRFFAIRREGEVTHDINYDGLTLENRKKYEKSTAIMGELMQADIPKMMLRGVKKQDWKEWAPWIAIVLVVLGMMLFFWLISTELIKKVGGI